MKMPQLAGSGGYFLSGSSQSHPPHVVAHASWPGRIVRNGLISIFRIRKGDLDRPSKRILDMHPSAGGSVEGQIEQEQLERDPRDPRDPPNGDRIVLQLSRSQVAMVLRTANASGAPSTLLSGLDNAADSSDSADVDELLKLAEADERRLSRSLLAGLLVLACFPLDGTQLGVAQLARRLNMSPSATHRYISTLLAAELLERDPDTRRYRLARKHIEPDA
ncbi:MAG: helix-turn-helix domain-containing protein [Solirubrobacterales bacterium]